jgi:hypothetical protein
MLNLFIRLEVQRRYFTVVSTEILMKSFGMKQPSILDNLISSQKKVSLDELIGAGRGLTVD